MKVTIQGTEHEVVVKVINGQPYVILPYANLGSANLRSANLGSANLRYADLRYADLRNADLRSANLNKADLYGANLVNANLWSADLSTVRNLELALNLDKVQPNAPKSLPEGWEFDPAKGIYLKPTAPATCQHIQTGKFCSECGEPLEFVLQDTNSTEGEKE